jgi:hypothetical protein
MIAKLNMQPILDHIDDVVRPALRRYMAAQDASTAALQSNDPGAVGAARQDVMLAARQAADVLHHLSDFVLKEPSPALAFANIEDVRKAIDGNCAFLRTSAAVTDIGLLRDVADAFKHHRPDRSNARVSVSTDVVPVGSAHTRAQRAPGA